MKSLILLGCLDDSLEVFGTLGPREWIAGFVVAGEEAVEEFLEILFGALHAVRQALLAENAEEALDQIQPRSMRGSVVKVNLWTAAEPSLAASFLWMLRLSTTTWSSR